MPSIHMRHSLPLYIISLRVAFEKLATARTIIETDRQPRRDYQQKKLSRSLYACLSASSSRDTRMEGEGEGGGLKIIVSPPFDLSIGNNATLWPRVRNNNHRVEFLNSVLGGSARVRFSPIRKTIYESSARLDFFFDGESFYCSLLSGIKDFQVARGCFVVETFLITLRLVLCRFASSLFGNCCWPRGRAMEAAPSSTTLLHHPYRRIFIRSKCQDNSKK